jgi:transcriptional regulator with XRE-family HTH domain
LLAATGHICYDLTNKIKEEQNMFGENLKTLRKEKGFSQEQLATRLNVVRQTISKWEKSVSVPDAETLIQLADVLEVEVSDLLGKKIEKDRRSYSCSSASFLCMCDIWYLDRYVA